MTSFRDIGRKEISWKAASIVIASILLIGGAVYAFLKVRDNQCERDYREALTRLHGLVDIEGQSDEHMPKKTREEMHQIMGREPDESGIQGKRLLDVYRFDGPLK